MVVVRVATTVVVRVAVAVVVTVTVAVRVRVAVVVRVAVAVAVVVAVAVAMTHMFKLSFNLEQHQNMIALVLLAVNDETVLIDIVSLARGVFNIEAARQNKHFRDMLEHIKIGGGTPIITVTMLDVYTSRRDAAAARHTWIKKNGMPYLNAKPVLSGQPKRIQCVTTGTVYQSQSEACRVLGINPAIMSQHLRGKGYYETIKGMWFKYV